MARTSKPSLIVLDIMMPNLDGFEVLTHLKADPTTAPIPVVVLTNLSTEENIERAMELGAVGYMIKSESDPSDVTKRVKEVLQKIG
jgi:putative two-component system response regulator